MVVGSVACLMIFKTWCRHHIGGTYATTVATAVLNLVVIIILGEVRIAPTWNAKGSHVFCLEHCDEPTPFIRSGVDSRSG